MSSPVVQNILELLANVSKYNEIYEGWHDKVLHKSTSLIGIECINVEPQSVIYVKPCTDIE